MKNFRKVLALILVVATLFSFVAMASAKNAEDYTDYDKVSYVEAVDVMTAIGINEGHNDGSFAPTATIDRDEVAAMIARLRYDGEFDADLFVGADNVFADVKGQWSEGYVTYCAGLGIINGRNATTFDPDGKVTGVETLKMLLCVLGYDAELQGYTGANWQTAVVRDANKMGLLIDGVDVYKAATREEVAQYFLNALDARLVFGYLGEGIVKVSNSLVIDWPFASVTLPELADKNLELSYCNAVISWKTLGEVLGVVSYSDADCFGRPGTAWYIGGVFFKFYADAPIATYTTAVDLAVEFEDDYAGFKYYHNGYNGCSNFATGNGVLTEVYANGVVVIIDTYMSVVVETNKRNGWAELKDSTSFDNTELNAEIGDVVLYTACNGSCGSKISHTAVHDASWGALAHCGKKVHAIQIVEPITVKVEDVHRVTASPEDSYFTTADGKTYEYALYLSHEVPVTDDTDIYSSFPAMDWMAKGTEKVLYLDNYGYVMYYADPVAETSYNVGYFVENTNTRTLQTTQVNTTATEYDYTAEVVAMDASKLGVITTDKAVFTQMMNRYYNKPDGETTQKLGMLAAYDDDGALIEKAKVAKIDTYLDAATGELVGEIYDDGIVVPLEYHCNADTQYLIRTLNFADGTYTYEAATGYKEVAEYVGKVVIDNVNSTDLVAIPTIQYIDSDLDGIIDYLFVDAFYEKTTGDYVYVLECEENIGIAGLGKWFPAFDLYKGIVNGEEAYVAYYGIGADMIDDELTGRWLKEDTLYRTEMQAVNATYQGKPIYVALDEADEMNLSDFYKFQGIVVENGQIALVDDLDIFGNYLVVERLAAEYNDELTVIVIPGDEEANVDLDGKIGVYTGTEFIDEFVTDEWLTGSDAYDVYAIGYPGTITTLIIELGTPHMEA